jgi:hypothetical protein
MGKASDDDAVQASRESQARLTRRFYVDGTLWLVKEVPVPSFDRRGGTHLLFDCESVMRRVRVFPPNWYELSDEELFALSLHIRWR